MCQEHLRLLQCPVLFKTTSDQFHFSSQKLFVVPLQMNSQLHISSDSLLGGAVCICVSVFLEGPQTPRNASLSGRPCLPSPPLPCSPSAVPVLPTPPPSPYKAAQQPIRGASPLIRVTNWRSAGAKTPPHLHGHVTLKRCAGSKVVQLGWRRGCWISLTEQMKRRGEKK